MLVLFDLSISKDVLETSWGRLSDIVWFIVSKSSSCSNTLISTFSSKLEISVWSIFVWSSIFAILAFTLSSLAYFIYCIGVYIFQNIGTERENLIAFTLREENYHNFVTNLKGKWDENNKMGLKYQLGKNAL